MIEDTKTNENSDKELFVQLMTSFGVVVLGMVNETSYRAWLTSSVKLLVHSPQVINVDPQKHTINLGPLYFLRTPQRHLAATPEVVEVLGDIERDEANNFFLKPKMEGDQFSNQLFSDYLKALASWSAALAGIQQPTSDDIITLSGQRPPSH